MFLKIYGPAPHICSYDDLVLPLIYPGLGVCHQLDPVCPLDDGPMPLFLVDPGLGSPSRLLDSVLHWDLAAPDVLLHQVILDYSHS